MTKVKIWNKTIMVWGFDFVFPGVTDIPVDDWHKAEEQHFHTLHDLQIISVNENKQREALMQFKIFRVSISPTTKRELIQKKIKLFDPSVLEVTNSPYSADFSVRYALKNGEVFCDSAIDRARSLFKTLGIEEDRLGNFLIMQQSLVRTQEGFIPYADYLRRRHNFKQVCTLWGKKIKIGDFTFSVSEKNAKSNFLKN